MRPGEVLMPPSNFQLPWETRVPFLWSKFVYSPRHPIIRQWMLRREWDRLVAEGKIIL